MMKSYGPSVSLWLWFFDSCLCGFEYQQTIFNKHILKTRLTVFVHLSLRNPLVRLSVGLDSELTINLTLSINFILHVMVWPFSFFFVLLLRKLYTFQCFLLRTETVLWTLLPNILWWNDNHSLIPCARLQKFLLMFCNLNYKYYVWYLCIYLCNDSDHIRFDNICHHYL